MEERRKYLRFKASVEVRFQVHGEEGRTATSSSCDISREGLRLVAHQDIPIGTPLELELHIPGDVTPVTAEGEVVWMKSNGGAQCSVGMRLRRIDRFDRARLLDYAYNEWLRVLKEEGVIVQIP